MTGLAELVLGAWLGLVDMMTDSVPVWTLLLVALGALGIALLGAAAVQRARAAVAPWREMEARAMRAAYQTGDLFDPCASTARAVALLILQGPEAGAAPKEPPVR